MRPPPLPLQAVADAARADKARQEWMETGIARKAARANAAELQKAALQDRVQQLEVRGGCCRDMLVSHRRRLHLLLTP